MPAESSTGTGAEPPADSADISAAPEVGTVAGQSETAPVTPQRRVVVWGNAHIPLQHDVIGPGDLRGDTSYGRLLVRSLMRAQLGLSLMCLALALTVTASYPVIMALLPTARRVRVLGLPLTLVVLGAGIYPVLLLIGWFYNRQASQLEAHFADLVDPAEHGRLDA